MSASVQTHSRQSAVGNGVPETYYSSQATYKAPPAAGRHPQYESPVIPDYITGGHMGPMSSVPTAGTSSRKGSHRRSQSQAQPLSQPAPVRAHDRAHPAKLPPLRTQSLNKHRPAEPLQTYDTTRTSRRYASDPISGTPVSPNAQPNNLSMRRTSGSTSQEHRRPSVPDRSPLQTLEVKLDDISKEEKRARVMDAERAAQQKMASTDRKARDRTSTENPAAGPSEGQYRATESRRVSGDERRHSSGGLHRSGAVREKSLLPTGALPYDGYPVDRTSVEAAPPIPPKDPVDVRRSQSGRRLQQPAGYGYSTRARDSYDPSGQRGAARESMDAERPAMPPVRTILPATVDGREPAGISRSGSKKLQKDYTLDQRPPNHQIPRVPVGQRQMRPDRMGHGAAYRSGHAYEPPDRVSREAVKLPAGSGLTYSIPPETAAGHDARTAAGFDHTAEALPPTPDEKPRRKWGFGMGSKRFEDNEEEDARRYVSPPLLQEWRNTKTAALLDEDLDLETPRMVQPAPEKLEKSTPWWEKSDSQRHRSSGSTSRVPEAISYDGNHDQRTGQTFFSPPLYLKCGPLLRFTGIYRQTRSTTSRAIGRMDKEIWRGSILIVTADSKSSYETAPILRLFKQPIDLLPPPPAEVDQQLAPEYVDPIAGQVKMSRVGKTLYVKPVEYLDEHRDLSRIENDRGLFSEAYHPPAGGEKRNSVPSSKTKKRDGETVGKVREIEGTRLHVERGVTFWKFKIEIELGAQQARIAYRINRGPAIGFWVPPRGQSMNIMFHSCNGFSLSVNPDEFSGPDPLWRDVLNTHQFRPFHVMIGGGDQIYNDAARIQTRYFREWTEMKNLHHKHTMPFSKAMQDELEDFYLNRYAMWFSQGLFGMANCQIPMVNLWDDHDIIDGFGSYPHRTMASPVFTGIGAVAFKYYMLFQHHSVPQETEQEEPSWLLGTSPGPYIEQLSRSVFMKFGRQIAFLGLDCRTERMRDEIVSEETYDRVFERLNRDIVEGETKHLIVLLGVPIAYPRLNFLENVLTSRAMDPLKALGRTGALGGFVNKFDGGVEILDDLDDHWTAKHHKHERNWLIQELQELAADKSIRITILSGDVHLAAVGQFYTNKKLGVPKDRDHRYMPNVISSAIVNTPPSDILADILNKRNKVHHLDSETDEDMISIFHHDMDGKQRNNTHLLPHRNWCSIREYQPGTTPPPSAPQTPNPEHYQDDEYDDEYEERGSGRRGSLRRTLSLGREQAGAMIRRFSRGNERPPIAYYNTMSPPEDGYRGPEGNQGQRPERVRASSADALLTRPSENSASYFPSSSRRGSTSAASDGGRLNPFHRRPSDVGRKSTALHDDRDGYVDLSGGLDVRLNVENARGDPAGTTTEYRLLIPALDYHGPRDVNPLHRPAAKSRVKSFFASLADRRRGTPPPESPPPLSDSDGPPDVDGAADPPHHHAPRSRHEPPTRVGNVAITGPALSSGHARSASGASPRPPYEHPPPAPHPQHRRSVQIGRYDGEPQPAGQQPLYPAAAVTPQTRIGPDGRPVRRRFRASDPYAEDAVLGREHVEGEADEDGPVSPPSESGFRDRTEREMGRDRGSGPRRRWLGWRI